MPYVCVCVLCLFVCLLVIDLFSVGCLTVSYLCTYSWEYVDIVQLLRLMQSYHHVECCYVGVDWSSTFKRLSSKRDVLLEQLNKITIRNVFGGQRWQELGTFGYG